MMCESLVGRKKLEVLDPSGIYEEKKKQEGIFPLTDDKQ
jgi:hypothetical protein